MISGDFVILSFTSVKPSFGSFSVPFGLAEVLNVSFSVPVVFSISILDVSCSFPSLYTSYTWCSVKEPFVVMSFL